MLIKASEVLLIIDDGIEHNIKNAKANIHNNSEFYRGVACGLKLARTMIEDQYTLYQAASNEDDKKLQAYGSYRYWSGKNDTLRNLMAEIEIMVLDAIFDK